MNRFFIVTTTVGRILVDAVFAFHFSASTNSLKSIVYHKYAMDNNNNKKNKSQLS
jgi:hypothetical protein